MTMGLIEMASFGVGKVGGKILSFAKDKAISKFPKGLKNGAAKAMKRERQQVAARYATHERQLGTVKTGLAYYSGTTAALGVGNLSYRLYQTANGRSYH